VRSAEEIRMSIAQTREQLEQTIGAIAQKTDLRARARRRAGEDGAPGAPADAGARQPPVPAAIGAAALAALLVHRRRRRRRERAARQLEDLEAYLAARVRARAAANGGRKRAGAPRAPGRLRHPLASLRRR